MLLSTSISHYLRRFDFKEIVKMTHEAGFDALDFGFFSPEWYQEDTDTTEFKKRLLEYRKMVEDKGMVFNQAHAPFPSSTADPEKTEEIFGDIVRSMKYASYLGIGIIVVHPCQHLTYAEEGTPEKLFEMNMDFYNRLKPYCEEYQIQIAIENMWKYLKKRKIYHSTCSRPEEFIKYIDALDSKWFVGCLDIGHATLVCQDPAEFIRKLGHDRLKALHVHDVDGMEDSHTLPFYGVTDWDAVTKALREIDYTGDFTFEAGNFFNVLPNELYSSASRHMVETGRYLMNKMTREAE